MEFRDVKRLLNMRLGKSETDFAMANRCWFQVHLAQRAARRAFPAPRLVVHSGRNLNSTLN
jgi:hypothetical protein